MTTGEQSDEIAEHHGEETQGTSTEPAVFVEYYTDPLCSWSWAFEAPWRRLRYECEERLGWRYRMGGLLPNWQSYEDPFNDIRNPGQMGPQWFQVREMTGMPLDERIWQLEPPSSSYPACLAVKTAERQGADVVEAYLRRLREAAMIECRNIARQDILLQVAEETAQTLPFDLELFQTDLSAPETADSFRQDLRDSAYHNIGRFPTLILRRADGRSILIVGYRPYDVLCDALDHLVPNIHQPSELSPEELAIDYINYWGRVLAPELREVLGSTDNEVSTMLNRLVASGKIAIEQHAESTVPVYIPAQ